MHPRYQLKSSGELAAGLALMALLALVSGCGTTTITRHAPPPPVTSTTTVSVPPPTTNTETQAAHGPLASPGTTCGTLSDGVSLLTVHIGAIACGEATAVMEAYTSSGTVSPAGWHCVMGVPGVLPLYRGFSCRRGAVTL